VKFETKNTFMHEKNEIFGDFVQNINEHLESRINSLQRKRNQIELCKRDNFGP